MQSCELAFAWALDDERIYNPKNDFWVPGIQLFLYPGSSAKWSAAVIYSPVSPFIKTLRLIVLLIYNPSHFFGI